MDRMKESRIKKERKEKAGISGWTSFVTILIIVNAIFFGWTVFIHDALPEDISSLPIYYLLIFFTLPFPLALINFIAVLFYVIKKKPQEGIGLFLSIIALLYLGAILAFWLSYRL
jgi:hypothetical protein